MPFGLKNAPATFQRLMNNVLSGLQGLYCFVYLDDIVIYANSIQDHENKLRSIFEKLKEHNLKLQPDKCEFMRHEVAYLGHIISNQGVSPDPEKTKAITKFPIPKNQKDIKSFLGLIGYYRKFIENFSKLTKPLTKLLKKDIPFNWTEEQQQTFDKLRNILISPTILKYPDFTKEFVLTTDASNFAIGAVLSQGEIGKDLPIAYASRTLNSAEGNYNTTEKELLAIKWAIQHFRPYLYGRHFKIVTDHRPLTWLFNVKDPGSKLVRWRLQLEEFDYEIIHKPGKVNSNADCLSRVMINTLNVDPKLETYTDLQNFFANNTEFTIKDFEEIDEPLLNDKHTDVAYFTNINLDEEDKNLLEVFSKYNNLDNFITEPREIYKIYKTTTDKQNIYHCIFKYNHYDTLTPKDLFYTLRNLRNQLIEDKVKLIYLPDFKDSYSSLHPDKVKQIIFYVFRNLDMSIRICHNKIITPNENLIPTILKENHDGTASGHNGIVKMYARIKQRYQWPNMKADITNYVKACKQCEVNKTVRKKIKAPMIITTTSTHAFERVALDIVGPLPETKNKNKYILTLQDDLTKFSQAFSIQSHDAETVSSKLILFITYFGIPKVILTDQGTEFMSNLLKEITKIFKIKKLTSTAYHPQTNGALERSHSTLKDYLKQYVSEDKSNWDEYVPLAMFAYNTSIHTSSKFTPHELVFGQKPNLPSSIENFTNEPNYDNYLENLRYKLNKTLIIARQNLIQSKEKSKVRYDEKHNVHKYKIDDEVYLATRSINKLCPSWKGPYIITAMKPNANVVIRTERGKLVRVHINRIKLANKIKNNDIIIDNNKKQKPPIAGYSLRPRRQRR